MSSSLRFDAIVKPKYMTGTVDISSTLKTISGVFKSILATNGKSLNDSMILIFSSFESFLPIASTSNLRVYSFSSTGISLSKLTFLISSS